MAKRRSIKSLLIAAGDLQFSDVQIPFEVRAEVRRDTRFSLTSNKAYLRVPQQITREGLDDARAQFETWLGKAVARRPKLADAHRPVEFVDGATYQLGEHKFCLHITQGSLKGASAKTGVVADSTGTFQLSLKLSATADDKQRAVLIEKLLYKVAGRQAQQGIQAQLDQINASHFQVEVGRLKLSPTRSRWGSCSSTGTISISSRLLGAPAKCLHAVLVHELAHRIEMNHSEQFWKLVYDAMPDYAGADVWLKENGGTIGWVKC